MRKIVSKKSEAKQRKRNQIIVGVILVFVMFGSVFGIVANNFGTRKSENKIVYNGVDFFKSDDYWFATIGDIDFVFRYNPQETLSISEQVNKLNKYSGVPLYVYSEDGMSEIEIYRNLQNIAERMQGACHEGFNCSKENVPTKTCEENFIIIQEAEEANIVQDENCVYITGKKEDLLKITDEFLFKTMGIKN